MVVGDRLVVGGKLIAWDSLEFLEVDDKEIAEEQVGILDIEVVDNLAEVDLQEDLKKIEKNGMQKINKMRKR